MNALILIYDIEHDGTRTKIADVCKDYGLDRIQYSAFVGYLSRNRCEALMQDIEHLLESKRGQVQLIPIAQKEWQARLEISHE